MTALESVGLASLASIFLVAGASILNHFIGIPKFSYPKLIAFGFGNVAGCIAGVLIGLEGRPLSFLSIAVAYFAFKALPYVANSTGTKSAA